MDMMESHIWFALLQFITVWFICAVYSAAVNAQ